MNLQDGMFMDGLLYATVSRNLALGEGTFWFPYLSDTFHPSFHEQLPLFFFVQSWFFKLLGNTMYAERICCLVMACLTAYFMVMTWREFFHEKKELKPLYWLPVLMWVLVPPVFWAYAHNVEETMMSVFAAAAVYFIVKALNSSKAVYTYLLLGSFSIFLCSFCKGPQGLFPLITVGAYWISMKTISVKKMLTYSLVLFSVPAALYLIFLLNDHSYLSLKSYFDARIVKTFYMEGRTTATNRYFFIIRLLQDLVPAIAVAVAIGIAYYLKRDKLSEKPLAKPALFFLLIGLSGSLPLMVTLEQRNFYRVTSIPFFALALAVFVAPYCVRLIEGINVNTSAFKFFRALSVVGVVAAIGISVYMSSGTKKGKDILPDIYTIGDYLGSDKTISFPADQGGFGPRLYLMRYYHISADVGNYAHEYLMQANESKKPVPIGYQEIDLELKKYKLYRKL